MTSTNGPNDPVYHYHSNYDSFYWMTQFGDPGFKLHVAMGQYLALLAYHLAGEDVIPFNVTNFGKQMAVYLEELKSVIADSHVDYDLSQLESAISVFDESSAVAEKEKEEAQASGDQAAIKKVNAKFRDFERGFVSQGGLHDREFYKHLIFAPGLDTGYAPTTFPGITEAVEAKNQTLANEFIKKTSDAILVAANILKR